MQQARDSIAFDRTEFIVYLVKGPLDFFHPIFFHDV